ncbi:865b6a4c-fd55-40fe-b9bb-e937a836b930 [Thermothielavioides terrestris]|uniref:865b6a4c-fd55-40fe-b9bb-e937a836b930 n=1 Tax=Thermothielavioides terrestris TaxID=2587410 RepID=A0A446BGN7_9PEZI|nr:865b6a4c-fd55-40fe-b9bb-e937a836b930 [Thermothielavioides terrestris]
MLAAHHDQENVYTHQAGASKQQLQAKTPGARYPKTPLRIPLKDENAHHGFGGKTKGNNENNLTIGKGTAGLGKSGKPAMVTPAEPRTARAPLGNKTTNAKARATQQTPGVKSIIREFERTSVKPTTTLRPKHAPPQIEATKFEVHTDKDPLEEEEIEYAPPRPKDIPYESDVFPDGVLTFEGLKPENLFKGYYQYYYNRVDEEGKTAMERKMEERQKRSFARGEEQIRKDMDEFDWSIGDIPESKDAFKKQSTATPTAMAAAGKKASHPTARQPSTIASRKAASALATLSKPSGTAQPKPVGTTGPAANKPASKGFLLPKRKPAQQVTQPNAPARERTNALLASRSTLGYNKGRSVSSVVHGSKVDSASRQPQIAPKPRALMRSASTASTSSEATITPARFAQSSSEWKKPDFLSIFDADEEEDGIGGTMPQWTTTMRIFT